MEDETRLDGGSLALGLACWLGDRRAADSKGTTRPCGTRDRLALRSQAVGLPPGLDIWACRCPRITAGAAHTGEWGGSKCSEP